ncbi:OLC1v1031956C1 [Oldenlandia corymbosa var. corymbosa]|uniref:OLC1v1031956C1 n=1 Tax=Oldenlandia corymbosa var. corymbosa TaxID=529605 RepID=A0AAV1CLF4_OLDCO|nr:OLC1v1031956C1 [Oldenlandia corymbosa var. corymbosa]
MSIRFKFRSSVDYDTVDIDGRSSISVGELRSKIIRQKNLNICQDFDLIFSDAVSGQEYDDEKFQIPSGSSVIVKRIPARSPGVPIEAAGSFTVKGLHTKYSATDEVGKFADVGTHLHLVQAKTPCLDLDYEKKISGVDDKANVTGPRPEAAKVQPVEQTIPALGSKGKTVDKERAEEQLKLEKEAFSVQNSSLPSEFKCSLCNTYFKDAVMIPCCQHSFCEKCIRQVLVERARCPKCFSAKCNVENLLPNLSLRHAVEHFLESQNLQDAAENDFNKYAPDGESGIQAKEVSCTVTVIQREPELPHSPTATGQGSNVVLPESFYNPALRRNVSFGPYDHNFKNLTAGRESLAPKVQKGENTLHQNNVCDEADSTCNRKREMWVDPGGGDGSFLGTSRPHKGKRTCYMCGSPEHLIRDCPLSSCPQPMLQTVGPNVFQGGISSYAPQYWHHAAYPSFRPFRDMYGNPAMMPFNAPLVPTYGGAPYVPNMYGLATRGPIRPENLPQPRVSSAEHPPHPDVELHYAEKKRKLPYEFLGRGQNGDDEDNYHERKQYCEPDKSHEYRVYKDREASGGYPEDRVARKQCKKNHLGQHGNSDTYSFDDFHEKSSRSSISGKDRRSYPSERSDLGLEHTNTNKHHSKELSKHQHLSSSKIHREIRQASCSDSSRGHHHKSTKEADARCRVDSDIRDSHKKQYHHMESHREPSGNDDKRRYQKDRESDVEGRHYRHDSKHKFYDDRKQTVSCSDEDREEDYRRSRKQKRVH